MASHLHYEKNSMRKSHRINIPLKIHVQNGMYDTHDWSLTGISVKAKDGVFSTEHLYDAVLMLGLQEATISLKVKLKCIYHEAGRYGFEFVELSKKNKKILRRYLELYLDGNLHQVDDLMSVYEEPDIGSAIQEPVKLNDEEAKGLEKSFLRRSIGAILVSLGLFSVIGALLYYNFHQ